MRNVEMEMRQKQITKRIAFNAGMLPSNRPYNPT